MGTRELREATGQRNGGTPAAINAGIRQFLPGGNECLDGLAVLHQMQHRMIRDGESERIIQIVQVAMDRMAAVAVAMEDEIRRRYDMPRH